MSSNQQQVPDVQHFRKPDHLGVKDIDLEAWL